MSAPPPRIFTCAPWGLRRFWGAAELIDDCDSDCDSKVATPESPLKCEGGRVAQLGEHRPYKPGVTGSSPVPPTNLIPISSDRYISQPTLFLCPQCVPRSWELAVGDTSFWPIFSLKTTPFKPLQGAIIYTKTEVALLSNLRGAGPRFGALCGAAGRPLPGDSWTKVTEV